ncbi:threonylcarbamoyl-AMP synthase [Candidatus Peregrinibacteria bacterium]|nr:threonylcarbamoyl-AMP synthase [Candidatus Peregrinibacteria bacterium]
MRNLKIDSENIVEKTASVLRGGGIVMHPTETCYGLAVDIFNERALDRLYKLKGMPKDKPLSILVDSISMAMDYGKFSPKAMELAHNFWPGPLAIMVPRTEKLPEFFNSGYDAVSIRYSPLHFCKNFVRKLKNPVTTTSANISGEEELYEVDLKKHPELKYDLDLIVDGGIIEKNPPSTIIKIDDEKVNVVREGGIKFK